MQQHWAVHIVQRNNKEKLVSSFISDTLKENSSLWERDFEHPVPLRICGSCLFAHQCSELAPLGNNQYTQQMVLLVSASPANSSTELLEKSGSKIRKKKKKGRESKLPQIWAACKCFGVRDKGTSLYRADLHKCFGFLWLELGPLHASNSNPLQLSTSASELFSWTNT